MTDVKSPSLDRSGGLPPAPEPSDEAAFLRGFVAVRYLLGVRGPELLKPLELWGSLPRSATEVAARLGHSDQRTRAQALAAELLRITSALDRWALR